MEHKKRKQVRLKNYDYAQKGAYFVTICTKNREPILSEILAESVGADASVRPYIKTTRIGEIAESCRNRINDIYDGVKTDRLVIMPDHIHGIIFIGDFKKIGSVSGGQGRPPLQKIMQGFKSATTRMCFDFGYTQIWQRSYVDHIIRDEEDYFKHLNYIEQNPIKWLYNKCEPDFET